MWLVLGAQAPATLPDESGCGPSHRTEVEEILRLRDPGAAASTAAGEHALGFDRALIIEDFLRLKAAHSVELTDAVRSIDERLLRSLRDSGRTTPEVCVVVRFMHEYYVDGDHMGGNRSPEREAPLPDVAAGPTPEPPAQPPAPVPDPPALPAPRPRPARAASAARPESAPVPRSAAPVPADAPTELELAKAAETRGGPAAQPAPAVTPEPAVEPSFAVASIQRERPPESDADVRRTALHLIADLEAQLKVPPYLTFREARLANPPVPTDELEKRRETSMRAVARAVALLTTMNGDPALRAAVQASLGASGRVRVQQGMARALKNVPDPEQRARAERLWSQLRDEH